MNAAVAAGNFWTSALSTDVVKNNPVLFCHFNRERKNLTPSSSTTTTTTTTNKSKTVQCQFCFATSPSTPPKFVVKRRRRKDSVTKRRVNKVFLFCSVCNLKMADRCFELNQREKLKVPIEVDGSKPPKKNFTDFDVVVTSSSKTSEKKKKKKKEKEQNAGLLIPTSMLKSSPKPNLSFAKSSALLKMIKSSEEVKEDKLKSFLKI